MFWILARRKRADYTLLSFHPFVILICNYFITIPLSAVSKWSIRKTRWYSVTKNERGSSICYSFFLYSETKIKSKTKTNKRTLSSKFFKKHSQLQASNSVVYANIYRWAERLTTVMLKRLFIVLSPFPYHFYVTVETTIMIFNHEPFLSLSRPRSCSPF